MAINNVAVYSTGNPKHAPITHAAGATSNRAKRRYAAVPM